MCLMKNKTNPFEAIEIETEKKDGTRARMLHNGNDDDDDDDKF